MTLTPGSRLGPYEIGAPLGAGGMGEVYRARDTRLDRTVAIKVLPAPLAADPEFRERFDREARVISQLDHPHICAIYDVGREDGTAYLVMQYLEGETLAERLQKGALPRAQAIEYAVQIGEALARAHRAGIIHRDLKPGNVMLTKTGARLLDFGLAKSVAPSLAPPTLTMPPTTPAVLTSRGTVLGTFQYMAPEQLEGAEADQRSDIWGFGCVLYEMLTGARPFSGKSHAGLVASVLHAEPPPLVDRAPFTPQAIEHIVRRCLEKDPEARWQSMTDVTNELRWAGTAAPDAQPRTAIPTLAYAIGAVLLLLIGGAVARQFGQAPVSGSDRPPLRFTFVPQPGLRLTPFGSSSTPHFAISPDGTKIAFVAAAAGRGSSLWIQALAARIAQEVPGSRNAAMPFWSSDGQSIGFYADSHVKTVRLGGERAADVAAVPDVVGATWNDDVILIGRTAGPILRVNTSTRTTADATVLGPEDRGQRFPQFLPDGHRFIYTTNGGVVMQGDLSSTAAREVIRTGATAVYREPGVLLYVRSGPKKLMAQTVDPASLQSAGPPREVLEPVDYAAGSGYPAISFRSDLVAYWDGSAVATQLAWFDRHGNPLPQLPTPANAHRVAISPDGQRVAFTQATGDATEGRSQVWMMDLHGTITRWSFAPENATAPIWSRDGSWLLFTGSSRASGAIEIFRRAVSGPAREESVGRFRVDGGSNNPGNYYATDTTADMRTILASVTNPTTGRDIVAVSAGSEQVKPVVNELGTDIQARFSPDGKQIAYASNLNSGPMEIYVEPFPRTGERWPISSGGGSQPVWRRDGKELFFLAPDGMMMASDMTPGAAPSGHPAAKLFATRARQTYPPYPCLYDVTFDGQRFLIDSVVPGTGPTISVVVNWSPVPR